MTLEILVPNREVQRVALIGTITNIDEDPSIPDALWYTGDAVVNNNTSLTVGFTAPSYNLQIGANLQTFRALVRKDATGGNVTTATIGLREAGGLTDLATSATFTINSLTGEIIQFTWNAALLANINGLQVEAIIQQQAGGNAGPSRNRRKVEIGAVEWGAEVGIRPFTRSMAVLV